MNVVHVVAAGEVGGAERMLVDLARAGGSPAGTTPALRHSVALFTPNDRLRELLGNAELEVDNRGRVAEGPLPFLASSLGQGDVRWLTRVLERREANIVHLHTFASQVLGTRAARRVRARVVRTEHSTRVYEDRSCWPFSRWSLRRADAVVCISDHVRRVALRHAPFLDAHGAPPVTVVRNGVDTTHFMPRPDALRIGAPINDRVRFVALGRLDPRKGLDLALEVVARVPRAELEIVGDGEARFLGGLVESARRLGVQDRVHFKGYSSDVREAIARADVALSSAREEGLGLALLEAMAMARPVVAVPVGGLVEIVRNGETGWLADARSPEALARAVQGAIDHPDERRRRGACARREVEARFSVAAMQHGYEAVYAAVSR